MPSIQITTRQGITHTLQLPEDDGVAGASVRGARSSAVRHISSTVMSFLEVYFPAAASKTDSVVGGAFTRIFENAGTELSSAVTALSDYAECHMTNHSGIRQDELINFAQLAPIFTHDIDSVINGFTRLMILQRARFQADVHAALCSVLGSIGEVSAADDIVSNVESLMDFFDAQGSVPPARTIGLLPSIVLSAGAGTGALFEALTVIKNSKTTALSHDEIKAFEREIRKFAKAAPTAVGGSMHAMADIMALSGPLPEPQVFSEAAEAVHAILEISPKHGEKNVLALAEYATLRKALPPKAELAIIQEAAGLVGERADEFIKILRVLTEVKKSALDSKLVTALKRLAYESQKPELAVLEAFVLLVQREVITLSDSAPEENFRVLEIVATFPKKDAAKEPFVSMLQTVRKVKNATALQLKNISQDLEAAFKSKNVTAGAAKFAELFTTMIKRKEDSVARTFPEITDYIAHFATIGAGAKDASDTFKNLRYFFDQRKFDVSVEDIAGIEPGLVSNKGITFNQIDMVVSAEKFHAKRFSPTELVSIAASCVEYEPLNNLNPFDDEEFGRELKEFFDNNKHVPVHELYDLALRFGKEEKDGFMRLKNAKVVI